MATYLLTWKPDQWGYEDLKERIARFDAGDAVQRWSCGTSKSILIDSRVLLMRQGKGKGGIFGSGKVVKEPFQADHYNEQKRAAGKTALYIMVEFDQFYDPAIDIKIDTNEIKSLDDKIWKSQGSGKKIPDELAAQLELLWGERTGFTSIPYPDDLEPTGYVEGSQKTIIVNAYERNSEARVKCIAHWGTNCAVCNFHFMLFYGELGRSYIHVHHLKPLTEIREEYEVDPIKDLRPVCPNCHSMLHRKRPALSIEELRSLVVTYGDRVGS